MTTSLDGRELAAEIRADAAAGAAALTAAGRPPHLAVVTATTDEASAWYVRSIARAAAKVGIACDVDGEETSAGITAALRRLSADLGVHGIILQTPLPGGARLAELAGAIAPGKDVDGANPLSLGRLVAGLPAFTPATAEAVLAMLDHYQVKAAGRRAVVVGRSVVIGKPVAHLLLDRDATVTICHSRTPDPSGDHGPGQHPRRGCRAPRADRARTRGPRHHRHRRRHQRHGRRRLGRRRRPCRRRGRRRAQPRPRRRWPRHHGSPAPPRHPGGRGDRNGRRGMTLPRHVGALCMATEE